MVFDPHAYFSKAAIERREQQAIPLDRPSDRPLKSAYVKKVRDIAGKISFKSRWFNMLYVRMRKAEKEAVRKLPCVKRVERVLEKDLTPCGEQLELPEQSFKNLVRGQTRSLGGEEFHEKGFKGTGIRIAVLDNGFDGVKENPIFDHLWDNGRILRTRDFVQDDKHVYGPGSHGRMVLSCIAGITEEGIPIGLAPEAEFLLARTERSLWEPFSEEENWLAAAEWADKHGARIINSSLGYTYHRYFPREMNGTSYVAKAANMAARKGILVVTSAGNSGDSEWRVIGTPADADSALSIGGISPKSGLHIGFSSFGPTADGEIKPNLTAYGKTLVASGSKGTTVSQGTSFSCPLVAGFAACAWETDPKMSAMEFFEELERSGHLYPYYDMAHGYGLPQASYFTKGAQESDPSFRVVRPNDSIIVRVRPAAMPVDRRKEQRGGKVPERLFYHIVDPSGQVRKYAVLEVEQREVLRKSDAVLREGEKMRVHYKGFTRTVKP